ncbi:hypothetical protein [Nocardia sputorum]|uniref:Uncharacterized protein n=1 Tax=Nocardia sputorum TaxID=2984338 RepID=A0ABN6U8Z2_9NOCA|nr:hypothetical protein [Nocardia sputorum]BDU01601.1 hypothetical protein IFM12276_46290 [Nocardia sputorum]
MFTTLSGRGAQLAIICLGWVAPVFVFWLLVALPESFWLAGTLIAALVAGAVTLTAAVHIVRPPDSPVTTDDELTDCGFVVGSAAWLLGGALCLVRYLLLPDSCGGSGGLGSFACLHRAGPVLEVMGVACALAATPVFAVLFRVGRRSAAAAWLSPAIVVSFYLLAAWLWSPHTGLGVPHRIAG